MSGGRPETTPQAGTGKTNSARMATANRWWAIVIWKLLITPTTLSDAPGDKQPGGMRERLLACGGGLV